MVKVRLTYVRDSEEEQAIIDKLNECFNVVNISKVYPGRRTSKYDNVYIDVEINNAEN